MLAIPGRYQINLAVYAAGELLRSMADMQDLLRKASEDTTSSKAVREALSETKITLLKLKAALTTSD
jgi:hypothetical protein